MSRRGHNPPPLITLDRVTARVRDRRLLPDTTWTLRAGQSWAVIGPNGAGKSTLAGILLGTVPCVSGKVIRHVPEALPERIGHVSFELLEKLAARESLRDEARQFSGRLDAVTTVRDLLASDRSGSREPGRRGHTAVQRFDLDHLMDRAFTRLSSGELRRVLIARALLRQPQVVVFDEPFEGLDVDSRRTLKHAISAMIREGRQVVLVTHRIGSLVPEISHALIVRDGQVVEKGPKPRVLPEDRLARLFAADAPAKSRAGSRQETSRPNRPDPKAPILVEMKGACVSYGEKAVLKDIDWTVRKGEHWAVLGPNGAGKSTVLSLIAGDHPQAYANRIFLFGRRRGTGESVWDIKRRIAMISPELQLRYRKPVSALDAVLSGYFDSVGLYRRPSGTERAVAEQWLEFVGLGGRGADRFDRLSYGERRRVLLARCLVKTPELLILDEPCQGLDPQMRRRFVELIDRIGSRGVPSILYVTHDEEEIPSCVDRIFRLPLLPSSTDAPTGVSGPQASSGSCKTSGVAR